MRIKKLFLHSVPEIIEIITKAIKSGRSLSLIRLGSGEAYTLAHDIIIPTAKIPWWVQYAGVKLPDEEARQALMGAIQSADIVGVSTDYEHWEAAPLLEQILTRLKVVPKYATHATINWGLHKNDRLYRIISKEPTALVGRLAPEAAGRLAKKGVNVVNVVQLDGFHQLAQAKNALLHGPRFRVALVAAGIPAAILCPRLARKTGCVAIDYGHVINDLIQPGFNVNHLGAVKTHWRKKHGL